jgi:hypothetical protein
MNMDQGADNIVAYLAGMDPGNQFFTYIGVDRQGWGAGWSGSAVAVFMTGLRDPRDLKGVELGGWDFSFTIAGKWGGAAKSIKNASWFHRMLYAARTRHALGAAELSTAVTAIKLEAAAFGIDMDSPSLDLKVLDVPFVGAGLEVAIYHGISRLWPFAIDLADEKVASA